MTRVGGDWLTSAATQAVFAAFEAQGLEVFCVGGCVRNALLGLPVADVDMSTAARPEQVIALSKAHGFKAIPTGIEHGTVTVIVAETGFEITTFRKDVETDGRRAVVAFSDHLEDDARRRDFTMNALYADRHGTVIDPLGGMPDLTARRIRFIDDADARIREDYLRILRFFRFFARFSEASPDPDTLDAIARNTDGLGQLSVERVTTELLNLLAVPDPAHAVGIMQQTGVLNAILPGADPQFLAPLVHVEGSLGLQPDPLARLAALAGGDAISSLRLSKAQIKRVEALQTEAFSTHCPAALGAVLGQTDALQALALRAAMASAPVDASVRSDVAWGAAQQFPVRASDLQPAYSGPVLGKRLAVLRAAWLASGLTLTKDALRSLPDE